MTRNHLQNIEKNGIECEICLDKKQDFKKCTKCIHSVCMDCFYSMNKNQDRKCPFCRQKLNRCKNRPKEEIEDIFYYEYSDEEEYSDSEEEEMDDFVNEFFHYF